jgi:hypothetical protein
MTKPPTPPTIDRRLRKAGHARYDRRTRMTKISVGYTTGWLGGGEWAFDGPVVVEWSSAPGDGGSDRAYAALSPLADTLTAAGYRVERAERVLPPLDGEGEYRWACLIVTAPPSGEATGSKAKES